MLHIILLGHPALGVVKVRSTIPCSTYQWGVCFMCGWLLSSVVGVLPCVLMWLSCDRCPHLSGEQVSSSVLSLMVWTERDWVVGGGGGVGYLFINVTIIYCMLVLVCERKFESRYIS